MHPTINPDDVVVTKVVDMRDVCVGDIITFKQPTLDNPDECITHRVFGISYEDGIQFQTKGDANENPDISLVNSSNFIGKVVFVIPYLGYLPGFVQSPIGFILLIIIPSGLLIFSEVRRIFRNREESQFRK